MKTETKQSGGNADSSPSSCSASSVFYRLWRKEENYSKTLFHIPLTSRFFYEFNPSWIQLPKCVEWMREEPKQDRPLSIAAFEQELSIPRRVLARLDSLVQYIPMCLLLPLRVGPKKALFLLKSYWRIDWKCWKGIFQQNVEVHTSATGGAASTQGEGCSDPEKSDSERVADCGATPCSASSFRGKVDFRLHLPAIQRDVRMTHPFFW